MVLTASFWVALPAGALLAALAVRTRSATRAGAAVGWLLLVAYSLAPGPAPLVGFVLFVVLGSLVSRLGSEAKQALGVGQDREGVRGVSNALANGGVGAALVLADVGARGLGVEEGLFSFGGGGDAAVQVAACAAVGACLSDTVASEIGEWKGGTPRHVLSLRRVAPGSDGAVSAVGLLASAVAAGVAALPLAVTLASSSWRAAALCVAAGAYAGNLGDTLLGATVEPRLGGHGNTLVNLGASLCGALVALGLWALAGG